MNSYVLLENKIRKNINHKTIEFQFELVCAKQTHPNYSVGSDQDKAEIQYDQWSTHKSSHQRCSMKKSVLRNFAKFTGNILARPDSQACNFIKKETLAQVFSYELCKISSSTFLHNTYGRLLLYTRMVQLWKM